MVPVDLQTAKFGRGEVGGELCVGTVSVSAKGAAALFYPRELFFLGKKPGEPLPRYISQLKPYKLLAFIFPSP